MLFSTKHLQALLTQSVALAAACTVTSAATYVSIVDLAIPTTAAGIYIDIDSTGTVSSTSEFEGWDINLFYGGTGIYTSDAFLPIKAASDDWLAAVTNVSVGSTVSASSEFFYDAASDPDNTDGSNIGGSQTHLGDGEGLFSVGELGYLGFKFTPNIVGSSVLYGWMEVVLTNNQAGGTVVRWAYEDSGEAIVVGAVPEFKQTSACIGIICLTLAMLRRRH